MKVLKWSLLALSLLFSREALGKNATYVVTAYCPCRHCAGHFSGGPTASGVMPQAGLTVAAPRSIPFGTILYIPGVGRRVVQDRLAARYDNRIDVFVRTHAEAKRFGSRRVTVVNVASTSR